MNKKNKLLFITAHFPSQNALMAGHKIAYERLEYFSENYEIDLIVISNKDEINIELLKKIKNLKIKIIKPLSKIKKIKNIIFTKGIYPFKPSTRFDIDILNYIKKNKEKYQKIHFEFTHAAIYCQYIDFKDILLSTTVHDVLLQQKFRSYSNIIDLMDIKHTFDYEQNIFNKMSTIYTLCEKDANLITSMYSISKNRIEVIKPKLSDFIVNVKEKRLEYNYDKPSILFWGAMNRLENEDAIISFLDVYADFLIFHKIKLYIVGNKPSKKIQSLSSKYIEVTGFIDDPSEYFIKSSIGIVPLTYGAGIKIKTLEMLESGMDVISTTIGAEGISHNNLYISSIDGFEKYLIKLLSLKV